MLKFTEKKQITTIAVYIKSVMTCNQSLSYRFLKPITLQPHRYQEILAW